MVPFPLDRPASPCRVPLPAVLFLLAALVLVTGASGLQVPVGISFRPTPFPAGTGGEPVVLPGPDFNVIIVGWDGVDRELFYRCANRQAPGCQSGLPNVTRFAGGRVRNLTVTNGATETKPGWAQLLTGYNAEVTGVYNNLRYQPVPKNLTIFERLRQRYGANITLIFLSGKSSNLGSACKGEVNDKGEVEAKGEPWCNARTSLDVYKNALGTDAKVGEEALRVLPEVRDRPYLAFIHFPEPDRTGHANRSGSPEYMRALCADDVWFGALLAEIKKEGLSRKTYVYVVTDHGFPDGKKMHERAPYGIMASNDPLVTRDGDRRDIAPTLYQRYGYPPRYSFSGMPLNGTTLSSGRGR